MKRILAAAAVFLLSCSVVQAATTFDFTNGNRAETTGALNYSVDGINLAVSAGRYYNPFGSAPLGVYDYGDIGQSNGNGLYMRNGYGDDHQIDGDGRNEVAIFQFDRNVTLESVSFTYFSDNDDFAFFFDVGDDGSLNLINGDIDANPLDAYSFAGAYLLNGDLFGIGAIGDNDDFKLASVTVSAVPLPAALPLYGAGIAVMGFVGWRRKQKLAAAAAAA